MTACPGCGVELPETGSRLTVSGRRASPECLELYGEVTARVLADPATAAAWQQTTIDAYAAQHVGPDTRPISVFFALNTLHLVLERGLTGVQGRAAHGHLADHHTTWPTFAVPADVGPVTVADVALADHRADHRADDLPAAVRRWGESVWAVWSHAHDEVRRTTEAMLGDWRPTAPRG